MANSVIALYDDFDLAEKVVDELLDNEIPGDTIYMIVNDDDEEAEFYIIQAIFDEEEDDDADEYADDDESEDLETGDLRDTLIDMGLAEEEVNDYTDAIRRGFTLLAVQGADDQLRKAERILARHSPAKPGGRVTSDQSASQPVDEAKVEILQEDFHVDKEMVEQEGARLQRYVTEEPVEEEVRLRREHVNVERRPADHPARPEDLDTAEEDIKVR